jgi:hypothetical protein
MKGRRMYLERMCGLLYISENLHFMRFQVLMMAGMKMAAFRDIAPCSLVEVGVLHGAVSQNAVIFNLVFFSKYVDPRKNVAGTYKLY